jgi:hypothetical protein
VCVEPPSLVAEPPSHRTRDCQAAYAPGVLDLPAGPFDEWTLADVEAAAVREPVDVMREV